MQLPVETEKRILTKEKIGRQLAGQPSSIPFMNIQEEHNKRVTFDMTDGLEQEIDKLMVIIGKLVTKDNGQNRQFKLQVYQTNRGRGQIRCNYEQRGFKTGLDQAVTGAIHLQEGQGMDKYIEVGQGMTQIIGKITETI